MNKINIFIIVMILCLGSFAGCANSEASLDIQEAVKSVPEPYTKMIENMNINDLEMTEKYADLVIKDFADSDYVYNAYLVKNMIIAGKMTLINCKISLIGEGIGQMGILNTASDIETVEQYLNNIKTDLENLEKDYELTSEYLLNNYSKSDLVKIDFPKAPSDMTVLRENDLQGLSWFAKIGTPVPTETDMNGDDSTNELKVFFDLNNGFLQDKTFSYVDYFYKISCAGTNEDLAKKLLIKVIELTEDDQYNEFRIQAQDLLNEG